MTNRRELAAAIVRRRVLALIPRSTADHTTVLVEYSYNQMGWPARDSWSGSVEGFAQRLATALTGSAGLEDDDLQASLREQLGAALTAAGGVPDTVPVEVLAQAGVLADAVLPVINVAMADAARDAILQAAALFEARGQALLDGGIMTAAEAGALLRQHATELGGVLTAQTGCPRNVIEGDVGDHFFKKGALADSPIACRYCGTRKPTPEDGDR